jgi:hypothetical protein
LSLATQETFAKQKLKNDKGITIFIFDYFV